MWFAIPSGSFYVEGPYVQPLEVGHLLIRGVWAPAVCHCGKPIISGILGRNRRTVVPRVMTPTVAPKPSVEWVAGDGHSIVGRIGSHVVL
jgi:hypothetical protein